MASVKHAVTPDLGRLPLQGTGRWRQHRVCSGGPKSRTLGEGCIRRSKQGDDGCQRQQRQCLSGSHLASWRQDRPPLGDCCGTCASACSFTRLTLVSLQSRFGAERKLGDVRPSHAVCCWSCMRLETCCHRAGLTADCRTILDLATFRSSILQACDIRTGSKGIPQRGDVISQCLCTPDVAPRQKAGRRSA